MNCGGMGNIFGQDSCNAHVQLRCAHLEKGNPKLVQKSGNLDRGWRYVADTCGDVPGHKGCNTEWRTNYWGGNWSKADGIGCCGSDTGRAHYNCYRAHFCATFNRTFKLDNKEHTETISSPKCQNRALRVYQRGVCTSEGGLLACDDGSDTLVVQGYALGTVLDAGNFSDR